jgi:hypothetical protein
MTAPDFPIRRYEKTTLGICPRCHEYCGAKSRCKKCAEAIKAELFKHNKFLASCGICPRCRGKRDNENMNCSACTTTINAGYKRRKNK